MKTTRSAKRMIALIAAFALSFSSMLSVMTTETYAASAKAPAKVGGVTGTGSGQTYASIKWKKIKKNKNTKGYTVYRNGAAVGSVGKGTSSFTDYNLAPGRTYTYQVRAYNTYKEKRWYNKKTGRYQKKKPAKKIRGKSKKFTRYKFGKASAATYVATKARANSASAGSSTGGNTGGETSSPYPVGSVLECTDYKGYVYKSTKISSTSWRNENTGSNITESSAISRFNNPQCNHTKDGSWGSGTSAMKQVSGATFSLSQFSNPEKVDNYNYVFTMYNGDPSKMTIELDSGVTFKPYNTYYWEDIDKPIVPATYHYFYNSNNEPIAYGYDDGKLSKDSTVSKTGYNITTKTVRVNTNPAVGTHNGIFTGTFNLIVKYNGVRIGAVQIDTAKSHAKGCSAAVGGMSANRRLALDIAETALAQKGKVTNSNKYIEMSLNMQRISDYIYETYAYREAVTSSTGASITMTCVGGANVLETYAVYYYHEYGFLGFGSGTNPDHFAYHLNRDPYNDYFEAQGRI